MPATPVTPGIRTSCAPATVQQVAGAQSVGVVEVPDLGPAVVVDQLSVLVWDAYAQGNGDGIPELLSALRRDLS